MNDSIPAPAAPQPVLPDPAEQVESLMGLVPWCVRRDSRLRVLAREDREQIGRTALLVALRRYDASRNVKLITYAARLVMALLRAAAKAEAGNAFLPLDERKVESLPDREPAGPPPAIPGLALLKPGQLHVLTRLYGLGGAVRLTPRELARELGCSLSNVYKRRDTALAALRGNKAA